METMEMINIINQNRNRVYKNKQKISAQKKARNQLISNLIGVGLEAILFLTFVEVISKIITR